MDIGIPCLGISLPNREPLKSCRMFRRWRLMPRVMRGVGNRSAHSTALGFKVSAPIGISPTAMQKMAHPDGECATARGAANQNSWPTVHFNLILVFVNEQPLPVTESSTLWVPSPRAPSKILRQPHPMESTGSSCTSIKIGIFRVLIFWPFYSD